MSDSTVERVGSDEVEAKSISGPSFLSSLKERREEVLAEQVLRLPVPRWNDPVIIVKYKPVPHGFIRAGQQRVEKASARQKSEIEVDANADILINGCVGVMAVVDGREYSLRPDDPNGDLTLFDEDLAENLGVEGVGGRPPTARSVVRALFLTDGDILSAAGEIVKFSGYRETEADSDLSGE